ncbi:hypothetical protein [Porphyromonas endodontalis]|uniref:hypothetical protein n=1 Tax=Porphyromonas endodontalis TaxID=28124 RepID=UPI003C71174D
MEKEKKSMCTSKLELMASRVKYRLDIINTDIENYNERIRRDYEYFFRWYADNLYTLHIRKNYYTQLMLTNTGDVEEMRLYLKEKIATFTTELLEGELLKCSNNPMTNIALLVGLKAKQVLRREFADLLKVLES